MKGERTLNIKHAAEQAGLSAHTIRFYEKTGIFEIQRSESGIRQFTDGDVRLLRFVASLRRTGMSLDDVAEITKDGCILERLESNDVPLDIVLKRTELLRKHRDRLQQQRQELDQLLDAVSQKLAYYQSFLEPESSP